MQVRKYILINGRYITFPSHVNHSVMVNLFKTHKITEVGFCIVKKNKLLWKEPADQLVYSPVRLSETEKN